MLARNSVRFIVRLIEKNVRFCSVSSFESIPSPRRLPLLGTTLSLILAGGPAKLHKYIDRRHKELGPIFRDNVGPVTAVFIADPYEMRAVFAREGKYPQHVKPESWLVYNEKHDYSRGLFFMDGEEWHKFRKIMNRILLKGDLNWIEKSCDIATESLIQRIHQQNGKEFQNIEYELYRWSVDVILSVLVGAEKYKQCSENVDDILKKLASTVHLIFENTFKIQLIPAKFAQRHNLRGWIDFELSVKESLQTANQLLDYVSDNYKGEDGLLYRMEKENMDRTDINRIVTDLILSAGDTTAYTMAWVLYLIAQHRNIQTDFRENLNKDPKTSMSRNIIRETLRLYPVAPFLTRLVSENLTVSGYDIPANTLIVMSIYTSGRNSDYFENPGMFSPNRWLRSTQVKSSHQASLPFGIGARSCIGRKIAETQLRMTTAKIVRNFDIDILNGEEIEDVLKMVTKPSEPLRLKFNKIKS